VRKPRDRQLIELVEKVQLKIELIRSGSAFTADFECASLLEKLVQEIKLLSFENRNYKKKITYDRLHYIKKEHEIKLLQVEKQELVEKLVCVEKKNKFR
tara:strand:- start:371 stop:667 length:297 start_codon:yes stop_codon:yes gene_type:complete